MFEDRTHPIFSGVASARSYHSQGIRKKEPRPTPFEKANFLMKKVFIDTNIFLRYLTKDDPVQYPRCRTLFKKAQNGEMLLITSTLVIAELIWTLASHYRVSKEQIIEKVSIIIVSDAVQIPDKEIIAEALVIYARKNIDYIDAYNSILMRKIGLKEIYSYDQDFDKFETVQRLEP